MHYFFRATLHFANEQTRLSSLVWATVSALWNMRAQVKGHLALRPDATANELRGRFLSGIEYVPNRDVRGVDLREFFEAYSWERDVDELARFTLISSIALYEGWLQATMAELGGKDSHREGLRFPTRYKNGTPTSGAWHVLNHYRNSSSPALERAFKPSLDADSDNLPAALDAMFVCYRAFNVVRNCILHGGGVGTKTAQQQVDLAAALTELDIHMEVPQLPPVQPGAPITVSLYGVIGFLKLLRRLVVTVEAVLSVSSRAETTFIARWQEYSGGNVKMVPRSDPRRARYYRNIATGMQLPELHDADGLHSLLLQHRLIREQF